MTTPQPQQYKRNAHHFSYGTCPVCLQDGERLITDHCHAHGWIRGRICESCNQVMRHEEHRHPMADILAGLCFHRHRFEHTAARCRATWLSANARRIAQYRRCLDCDQLAPEPYWPVVGALKNERAGVPVPTSYSEITRLQKHGGFRAAGPCQVCYQEPPHYETGASRFTYDHCHEHDFVRGVLCRNCNQSWMTQVDRHLEDMTSHDLWPALLANWNRCPQCAAKGWRALWRRDKTAEDAWSKAWEAAALANPAMTNAELHEVSARAARAVSPNAVRGVLGALWCVPIARTETLAD
jgi:hypothetical protein